jgi:diguanylate cyclase (GGDEF)-like protein
MHTLALQSAGEQNPLPQPALWSLLLGLSATGAGRGYFARLARELASLPGIDLALVAELVEGEPLRARTLSVWADGAPGEPMRFGLRGTPCEGVLRSGLACFASRLRDRFPEEGFFVEHRLESYAGMVLRDPAGAAIGWVAVAGRLPLVDPGLILSALEFVVARTALEPRLLRVRRPGRQPTRRLALLGEAEGLWECDVSSGRLRLSPRARMILGLGRGSGATELEDLWDHVHPDDRLDARAEMAACAEGGAASFEAEFRVETASGLRWIHWRGMGMRRAGGAVRLAGSATDVTARRLAEERLEHAAYHDPLTGLPNRARFLERLEDAMARAVLTGEHRFALLFLDLDRFKVVNDSLGHAAGDELLRQAAARLLGSVGDGAMVGRLGGDEFAVLLDPAASLSGAEEVARGILEALSRAYWLEGNEVFASASVGLVMGGEARDSAEALLRDADTALYRAKEQGKARYAVFDRGLHDRAVDRLRVEMDLRRAAERGELRVVYQPIVTSRRGTVMGFEALLRWQHPTLGLVPPSAFVPVAEETGQIVELGDWVLRAVAGQLDRWTGSALERLAVSVNLSPRQVQDASLAERVASALGENRVGPGRVRLEITEGCVLGDAESAIAALRRLRALGVGIWVDDFGSGYSSLAYLARLPVTALKIDRTFVSAMYGCERTRQMIRAVVRLAERLRLGVVAEGVETREQLRLLRGARVPLVQGYLAAPPLEADAAAGFARRRTPSGWLPLPRGLP